MAKLFTANFAAEPICARVTAHVSPQCTAARELLGAKVTAERSFAGVDMQVGFEVRQLCELAAANVTGKFMLDWVISIRCL